LQRAKLKLMKKFIVFLFVFISVVFISTKNARAIIPRNVSCTIGVNDCVNVCAFFFALNQPPVDCSSSGGLSSFCTQQGPIPNNGVCVCNCQNYYIECVDDSYCQAGEFCSTLFWRCINPNNICHNPTECTTLGQKCEYGECVPGCDQNIDCNAMCPGGVGGTCTPNGSCDCNQSQNCQITYSYIEACREFQEKNTQYYQHGFPEDPACNGCGTLVGCDPGEYCSIIYGTCIPDSTLCPSACTLYGICPSFFTCNYNSSNEVCEPVNTCTPSTHPSTNCYEFNGDPAGCASAGEFACLDNECFGDDTGTPGTCKFSCNRDYYHVEGSILTGNIDTECLEDNPLTPRCCILGGNVTGGGGTSQPLPATCTPQSGGTGIDTAIGCIPVSTQNELVRFFIVWGIGIGGGIAILILAYASIIIATSGGNIGKISAGKQTMTAVLAGLLLLILSVFILRLIGVEILRLPGL
jgi:hypothetical protein